MVFNCKMSLTENEQVVNLEAEIMIQTLKMESVHYCIKCS